MGVPAKTAIQFEGAEGEVFCEVYGVPVGFIQ